MPGRVLRDCLLQAKRFTAPESESLQLVDKICPENKLMSEALLIAEKWMSKGEHREVYHLLKKEMYRDADKLLGADPSKL
jgi:enoyl-CoA hydratase/carnithine racemase